MLIAPVSSITIFTALSGISLKAFLTICKIYDEKKKNYELFIANTKKPTLQ